MFKTQGFTELSDEALSYILKSNKLTIDEVDILKKVAEWGTVNAVNMINAIYPLKLCILSYPGSYGLIIG